MSKNLIFSIIIAIITAFWLVMIYWATGASFERSNSFSALITYTPVISVAAGLFTYYK